MLRHALAPIYPPAARALDLPRTLAELPQPPSAAGGPQATGVAATARATQSAVAITFDDGPHPEGTPQILQILAEHDVRATFFVVGEQVRRRPHLLQRITDEGHRIALHGDQHRLQLRLTRQQLDADLTRGIQTIEDATNASPAAHRPPYGIYSPQGLAAARARNLQPVLWSTWGKDWRKFTTPPRIAARATQNIGPGDIILLHDADFYSAKRSHERTAHALPLILRELKSREIGTVLAV